MIVYKIKNKINEKTYVGVTTFSLDKRIGDHIKDRTIIGKAIRKYGIQSFEIAVIDSASSKEVLFEKEKYWIKFYNSNSRNGYNLTAGGEGLINPSKSVRKRISKKVSAGLQGNSRRKGVAHTIESKKAISEGVLNAHKNNPNIKKKMSVAHKGKPFTEEHKKKLSDAHMGIRKGVTPWNKGLHLVASN